MLFKSTRGHPSRVTFEQAILSGYAPDQGLWVPENLPNITSTDLHKWKTKSFPEICALVLSKIIQTEITFDKLLAMTEAAFATFKSHNGTPLPLIQVQNNQNPSNPLLLLETFHGPTLAFKDIGLQVLARLVNHFLEKRNESATILMETSGDTGPAALSAAANLESIELYCLYPKGRVSRVQELQCTTAAPLANNLHVYRTEGTTDDQAATIKEIFKDMNFVSKYTCCSMNSINVGRIATQSSYYVYTYLQAVKTIGDPLDFVIPTGAFGNALGGFWAKTMGLPIRNITIATNANDICHRAVSSGDFSPKESVATVSPAMDIQLPYNFERFLHCLLGGSNGAKGLNDSNDSVSKMLLPLLNIDSNGHRMLPIDIVKRIQKGGVYSQQINDVDTLATIRKYWKNHHYLLDPHSAIGVLAAENRQDKNDAVKCVVVLTADPSKFEQCIQDAIGEMNPNMPERVKILDALEKRFDTRLGPPIRVSEMGGSAIPEWIEILKEDIRRNARRKEMKNLSKL